MKHLKLKRRKLQYYMIGAICALTISICLLGLVSNNHKQVTTLAGNKQSAGAIGNETISFGPNVTADDLLKYTNLERTKASLGTLVINEELPPPKQNVKIWQQKIIGRTIHHPETSPGCL
jgi:hypothetical protein